MSEYFLHGCEVVQIDDGIRPIKTVKSSIIGLIGTAPSADAAAFPFDVPVLVNGPRQAAKLGAVGTLLDAYNAIYAQGVGQVIVIRPSRITYEAGSEPSEAEQDMTAVIGEASSQTGIYGFLTCQTKLGLTPRILVAPGFTGSPLAGSAAVIQNMIAVAERLRAVVPIDMRNGTLTDALVEANTYGSERVYPIWPHVRIFDTATSGLVTSPASAFAAGAIAARDREKGFWWSPSNQVLNGVLDTAQPVSFGLSDPEADSNLVNEEGIATIVQKNGFRLWGNRTQATDPLWAFLSVRRTADMIYESIEEQHLWAMDRPFSAQLLEDIRDGVQAYIDRLVALGALIGGRVWLDPELNTAATLQAGKLFLSFDIEPPAPLEHLIFRAHRNGSYYEDLVSSVIAVAA